MAEEIKEGKAPGPKEPGYYNPPTPPQAPAPQNPQPGPATAAGTEEIPPAETAPATEQIDYHDLTVAELKDLAHKRGVEIHSDMLKDDIIQALKAAE